MEPLLIRSWQIIDRLRWIKHRDKIHESKIQGLTIKKVAEKLFQLPMSEIVVSLQMKHLDWKMRRELER